jgi:hypothetical protein
MQIKLEFYVNQARKHPTDQTYALEDERKELVFHGNNQNQLAIRIYSGATYHDLVDITGYVFDFIVKVNPTDTDAEAIINIHQTDLTDPTNGKVNINVDLSASGYADLLGNYLYELRMTTDTGRIKTLCYGTLGILQSLFNS